MLLGLFLFAASVVANEPGASAKKANTIISAAVYDELIKAQDAQEKGDIATALAVLEGLKNRSGRRALSSYEQAQLWNFYA